MSRYASLLSLLVLTVLIPAPGIAQLQSRADLLELSYHEDRAKGLTMLNQRYIAIYSEAMKAALEKQDLETANTFKIEIERLKKENDSLTQEVAAAEAASAMGQGVDIVGKTVRFASNRDPDFTIRIVFLGEGKATWIGLGNVRVDYEYDKGEKPLEFIAWSPTQSTKARGWKVTMEPDGISGTITNLGSNYTTEAKIVPSRSDDLGK